MQSFETIKETSRFWSFPQRYTGGHDADTPRDEEMKLFLDCEFTQLNRETKLISLALVPEVGEAFYVELTDTYRVEDCSEFVIQNVLPQLHLSRYGKSLASAQTAIRSYLDSLRKNSRFARMRQIGTGFFSASLPVRLVSGQIMWPTSPRT